MKKITGKVVALVLALALVVTSFSANFAFATTKTMSGSVSGTDNDTIYLVNGGTDTGTKSVDNLNGWINATLETKDHSGVDSPKISAISHVSGDKLVSLSISSSNDTDAVLKLKSSTADGKEVVSVLYEGTYTNDDGDEYTVKATKQFTVYVYSKDAIVFGKYGTTVKDSNNNDISDKTPGKSLDDVDTFAQTMNYTETIGVFQAEPSADSAKATYKVASGLSLSSDSSEKFTNPGFVLDETSGSNDVHLDLAHNTANVATGKIVAIAGRTKSTTTGKYTANANVGNVTLTVKRLDKSGTTYKASTDSSYKYTLKSKVEKKVDVATVVANGTLTGTSFTIKKDNGSSVLTDSADSDYTTKVTDCNVVFDSGYVSVDENTNVKKISGSVDKVTVGNANVDSILLDNGDVDVTDGKVGDITTGNSDTSKTGNVTVEGGRTGNIDTTSVDVAGLGDVTVTAGTTGTIASDDTVELTASDSDSPIITGKITAPTITAFADEAKIDVAGIKASADGTITLKGDSMNAGAIDLDYRATTLNFGDTDDAFTGKASAPINGVNGKIATVNADTVVALTGGTSVDTISLDTDSNISFDGAVTVDTIDGDGSMKVAAGKLYVTGSASGVTLKLSDTTLAAGTTVFKADTDTVDVDSFNTFGFTLVKSTGTTVDTFKIATLSFAGPVINKAASSIAKGYSETFTASAYPTGTSIPTGDTITWELVGGSSDVFTLTTSGNTATVKVNSIDASFASENKTQLTATLYDADGYILDDYDVATCDITATAVPSASSDTNSALSVAKGASYTMKVTSATVPSVTTGSNGVFSVVLASKNGNNYFYKLTATGTVGASTGVYLNGSKIFVATVKAFAFTSDTTKATVKGAYTFKITSATTPTVSVGSAAFKLAFVSKTGNAYLYKITSAGKAGASAGIYVNGSKAFVATVG